MHILGLGVDQEVAVLGANGTCASCHALGQNVGQLHSEFDCAAMAIRLVCDEFFRHDLVMAVTRVKAAKIAMCTEFCRANKARLCE